MGHTLPMIRQWRRSPTVLKLLVGQHIVNGLSVSAGVAAIAVLASLLFGFAAGQPATLGAIAASIADFPAPFRNKARTLIVGFALAIGATLIILLVEGTPPALILAIGAVSFGAGLISGYGRWALALSMQMLIPVVFVLSLPPTDLAGTLVNEILFAGGGLAYIAIALLLTMVTDAGGRRMMTSEALREFSAYLRAVSAFYEEGVDLQQAYGAAIRQQAALADQLQSARALLLDQPMRTKARARLAASIGILLDTFDDLVAAHVELVELRRSEACKTLMARIRVMLRVAALDLDHLSLDLLSHATPRLPPDHSLASYALLREADKLFKNETLSAEARAAAQATSERLVAALEHVRRLERALSDDEEALASMRGIDLAAFAPRPSFDPKLLWPHFNPNSPVFRFAARLALAMTAGALVSYEISGVRHGNWVLLTIAVVMRASYGLTKQRRNDRVIGTLIGCVLAALLIAVAPIGVLVVAQVLALGFAHGFARLRYLVTSIAASVVALLSVHLSDPKEAATVFVRLTDTLIGAALAHLFSYVLPRWEFNEAPRLVARLQADVVAFARTALRLGGSDQDYRLARKRMIEGLAALSDSAGRMSSEPQAVRRGLNEMADMLIAGYVLAANISATRFKTRCPGEADDRDLLATRLAAARDWLTTLLSSDKPPDLDGPALVTGPPREELTREFLNLRKAAVALITAASAYRRAAALA
ncbi:MAG TPA: FUSC family membrane protein [Roseiarcus sp.]|nr:FUSC family membrane protein [Roseiarcus sp.]